MNLKRHLPSFTISVTKTQNISPLLRLLFTLQESNVTHYVEMLRVTHLTSCSAELKCHYNWNHEYFSFCLFQNVVIQVETFGSSANLFPTFEIFSSRLMRRLEARKFFNCAMFSFSSLWHTPETSKVLHTIYSKSLFSRDILNIA